MPPPPLLARLCGGLSLPVIACCSQCVSRRRVPDGKFNFATIAAKATSTAAQQQPAATVLATVLSVCLSVSVGLSVQRSGDFLKW